jgi:anti-sigma regulatory factor (Ser/Thr protein kinase)
MKSIGNNLSLTFRAERESVPEARRSVSEFASAAGADRHQVDAVRLAVSEAMTNAVLHAYGAEPGNVYVTAAAVPGELWVLIADEGGGLEPRPNRPGLGLGLALIAQVSDELAIVPRAGGGLEVRMRFELVRADRAGAGPGNSPPSSRAPFEEGRESRARAGRFRGQQQYA